MIHSILARVKNDKPDLKSIYGGTTLQHINYNDLYISFRPILFRGEYSIMFHTIEANIPGKKAWTNFWNSCLKNKQAIHNAGVKYILIDCILDFRFEKHIAKTWELIKAGELWDLSTYYSTYCFKIEVEE